MPMVKPQSNATLTPASFVINSSKARVDTTIMKIYKFVDKLLNMITSKTILISFCIFTTWRFNDIF